MHRTRRCGVLIHPTSLPGPLGVGDFGPGAIQFLDWMEAAGQSIWQVLPLGPPGPGHSPYSSTSAFAGSLLQISPEILEAEGLLPAGSLDLKPELATDRVDYPKVASWKEALLRVAWQHARRTPEHGPLVDATRALSTEEGFREWLPDWTLFQALKRRFDQKSWQEWPRTYRTADPVSLEVARRELEDELHFHAFCQLLWWRQWETLRREASSRGILVLGDVPIYPALDSADVWSHQALFELDAEGRPEAVSGVPPDAFSDDGQVWGNPLYRWDRMRSNGFRWWAERLRHATRVTDKVRLDHFRGFAGYWRVPEGSATAREGQWMAGPGADLFHAARAALGSLPLVAEDLGEITPDVHELRREIGVPGTRVFQFAFDDPESEHLPHNLDQDIYFYSGTHDNPTLSEWLEGLDGDQARDVGAYVGGNAATWQRQILRSVLTSVAEAAILPMQDVLGLGAESRMNVPGQANGNWEWRLQTLPGENVCTWLRGVTRASGRLARAGAAVSR